MAFLRRLCSAGIRANDPNANMGGLASGGIEGDFVTQRRGFHRFIETRACFSEMYLASYRIAAVPAVLFRSRAGMRGGAGCRIQLSSTAGGSGAAALPWARVWFDHLGGAH